jgi:glutamine amidotransferase
MCVAIYKPKTEVLTKAVLAECFRQNSDGAGYAYLTSKKTVVIVKGFFSFKEFWRSYRDHMHQASIIHFRWATHGTRAEDNCHPFSLPDGALIHNGIISWATPSGADSRSDTRIFTEDLLVPFLQGGMSLQNKALRESLETSIGIHNKVVMFYRGEPVILNEAYGSWVNGVWFSNTSWQTPVYTHKSSSFRGVLSSRFWDEDSLWAERLEDEVETATGWPREASVPCDICHTYVPSRSHLVSISPDTLVCPTCWNGLGTWQTEVDEFERERKIFTKG